MEQSYPLTSYSYNHSGDIDHDVPRPSDTWQQPRQAPNFSVQRKHLPRERESSGLGYELLDEASSSHRPSPPRPARTSVVGLAVLSWWFPELFASVLAVFCLLAIVIVLRWCDGRLLQDISLPKNLTLNGVIAAISTVARVALMVPIASALSQEGWIWFVTSAQQRRQQQQRNRQHISRLRDLDLSDNASRGAWGSLLFLFFARKRWIAYIGAIVTIVSLALGTFTQQLLAIESLPVSANSNLAPGNLPRVETWQYWNTRPSEGSQSLPLDLRAALYNGVLSDQVNPIVVTCDTGNCTWPTTSSLAICGACSPTAYVQNCNSMQCNYTTTSGAHMHLGTSNAGTYGFEVLSSYTGGMYNGSDRLYIAQFDAVGAPYGTIGDENNIANATASECALWMCVQSYDTSMVSGKLIQNVTAEFSNLTAPVSSLGVFFDNYTFAELPALMRPVPAMAYNVAELSLECFSAPLYTLFNGTIWLDQDAAVSSNDAIEAIWNASSNLDPWIKNVAYSLTNTLRYNNLNPRPESNAVLYATPHRAIYDGTAFALGIRVHWYWLILPVVCVILSMFVLATIIIRSARYHVVPWKSSLSTFLFFEADEDLKRHASRHLGARGGVLDAVGDVRVMLREGDDGKWVFKKTD